MVDNNTRIKTQCALSRYEGRGATWTLKSMNEYMNVYAMHVQMHTYVDVYVYAYG